MSNNNNNFNLCIHLTLIFEKNSLNYNVFAGGKIVQYLLWLDSMRWHELLITSSHEIRIWNNFTGRGTPGNLDSLFLSVRNNWVAWKEEHYTTTEVRFVNMIANKCRPLRSLSYISSFMREITGQNRPSHPVNNDLVMSLLR